MLDGVCERAEQAEASSRETLIAIVDALNTDGMEDIVQRLREEAAGESLLALERLIRAPRSPRWGTSRARRAKRASSAAERCRWASASRSRAGRTGRRSEAPGRPAPGRHPPGLRNPRMVEEDVVRLAARRPGRRDVLAEIARAPWAHRPRVRMTLVMNPATPIEVATRLAGLLLRPELARWSARRP